MSTIDQVSPQEEHEAEELRRLLSELEPNGLASGAISDWHTLPAHKQKKSEPAQLAMLGKLSRLATQPWLPRNDAAIRNEVLQLAAKKAQRTNEAPSRDGGKHFLTWLGLGIPAVAALFIILRAETPATQQETSLTTTSELSAPSSAVLAAPAEHANAKTSFGGLARKPALPSQRALLRAQALALTARGTETNSQETDVALDQAWSDYRGQLIAQLEEP